MPQGKGPLVLRTNIQFSVKTRSVRHSTDHHSSAYLWFIWLLLGYIMTWRFIGMQQIYETADTHSAVSLLFLLPFFLML